MASAGSSELSRRKNLKKILDSFDIHTLVSAFLNSGIRSGSVPAHFPDSVRLHFRRNLRYKSTCIISIASNAANTPPSCRAASLTARLHHLHNRYEKSNTPNNSRLRFSLLPVVIEFINQRTNGILGCRYFNYRLFPAYVQ